jgi:hypothetical protein
VQQGRHMIGPHSDVTHRCKVRRCSPCMLHKPAHWGCHEHTYACHSHAITPQQHSTLTCGRLHSPPNGVDVFAGEGHQAVAWLH